MSWKHQIARLGIGIFAGICAALFPRLIAALASSGSANAAGKLVIFSSDFLILAGAFSLIIGVATLLMEFRSPTFDPRQLLVSALGVPALLAGSFNMSSGVGEAQYFADKAAEVSRSALETNGLSILPPDQLPFSLDKLRPPAGSIQGWLMPERSRDGGILIASALAQETGTDDAGLTDWSDFAPGALFQGQKYIIILQAYPTVDDATGAAKMLQVVSPGAYAVEGTSQAYVLDSSIPQSLPDATLRALDLNEALKKLNPSADPIALMAVPAGAE
jgi:hypothetical protein